jgi:hypothetical protein
MPTRCALRVFSFAALLHCAAACARVQPYERETLARRDMRLESHPDLVAGEQHARDFREGSSGGAEAKGGGCGCN